MAVFFSTIVSKLTQKLKDRPFAQEKVLALYEFKGFKPNSFRITAATTSQIPK